MTVCLSLFIPINSLAVLSSIAIAGGVYFLFAGFRLLERKRVLLATPRRKIGGAAMGPIEVNGRAVGPHTIPAPITGQNCFLYHATAWQQREGKSDDWEKVADEALHLPFFIDDSTGQLLIEPLAADLDLLRDFREEYAASLFSSDSDEVPLRVRAFLSRHSLIPSRRLRIEEHLIKPEDVLFVAGTLMDNPGVRVRTVSPHGDVRSELRAEVRNDESRIDSPRHPAPDNFPEPRLEPQVIRLAAGAAAGSSRQMGQQAKIAAALTRAGIASPDAWSAAGISCQTAPLEQHTSQSTVSADPGPRLNDVRVLETSSRGDSPASTNVDLTPPVVLMKGSDHSAFVISFRSGKELVNALGQKSAAFVWGGGAITLLGLYILLRR